MTAQAQAQASSCSASLIHSIALQRGTAFPSRVSLSYGSLVLTADPLLPRAARAVQSLLGGGPFHLVRGAAVWHMSQERRARLDDVTITYEGREDRGYSMRFLLGEQTPLLVKERVRGQLAGWESGSMKERELLEFPVSSTVVREPSIAAEYSRGKKGPRPHLRVDPGELASEALLDAHPGGRWREDGHHCPVDEDLAQAVGEQVAAAAAVDVVTTSDVPEAPAGATSTDSTLGALLADAEARFDVPRWNSPWYPKPRWTARDRPFANLCRHLAAAAAATQHPDGSSTRKLVVVDDTEGLLRADHLAQLHHALESSAKESALAVVVAGSPDVIDDVSGAGWADVKRS